MDSLHELRMRGLQLQPRRRASCKTKSCTDATSWARCSWATTSTRGGSDPNSTSKRPGRSFPGQNATTLQVVASVLGAVVWMIRHPDQGFNVPDDLPHDEVLGIADPYLGPCPSVQSDWTPLSNRRQLFADWGGKTMPAPDDTGSSTSFLAYPLQVSTK